jgi:hypothetical protein
MATLLGKIVADFRTTLATELAVGGTSATLQSATDADGNAIPSGTYYFTLDKEGSQKEHIVCSVSGTAVTSISSVSRQGVVTSGSARKHRIGASVEITDFAHISRMNDLLAGTTDLNASDPLKYDAVATLTPGSNELCTVAYADALTFAGAPNGSTTQKGIFEEATVAEQGTATATGSTGARLIPANANLVKTSSGAGDENKIAILGANGVFADGFLDAARTWTTVQSFSANNCQITTDADSANDAVRKSFMDAEIVKGAITGTSGEAISVGQGVYIKASDNKYYKTVGTGDESTYSFAGVALTAAGGADVAFTFAPPGHVVTTSGLTAGAYYFVSDTAGTLATTPGTRFARVGRALSTTLLQVLDPKFIRRGSFTVSGTGNTSVTTGFYPAHIQIRAACDSGGAGGYGLFSIGDDSNTCVRKVGGTGANDDAVNGSAAASLRLATPADALLGTVSAKSATGFTFNTSAYSADGGNLTNHTIQWAAFSE